MGTFPPLGCVCVCVFGKSSINKEIVIALITKNRIPESFYYRDLILLARLTCLCKSSFGDKCSTDSPACKQVNKKNHLFNSIIEHQLPSLTTQLHWISRYISTDYIPIQDMWILAHNKQTRKLEMTKQWTWDMVKATPRIIIFSKEINAFVVMLRGNIQIKFETIELAQP